MQYHPYFLVREEVICTYHENEAGWYFHRWIASGQSA